MLFRLAVKNIVSKKSSFIIIMFIAFAIMLLVITNAIFDSTENGVKQTFIDSFTGDVVIRPKSRSPLSLFGDETPVTGELTKNISLVPYLDVLEYASSLKETDLIVRQVSGAAAIEKSGRRILSMLFGVDGVEYSKAMSAIKIIEGKPFSSGEKGVMLTKDKANQLKAKVGDIIQFSVADGISFRIRACPLSAIYEYKVDNKTLEKIALIDDATLRELMELSETKSSSNIVLSDVQESIFTDDLDDDFFTDSDTEAFVTEESDSNLTTSSFSDVEDNSVSTSWNFLILKLKDSKNTERVINKLNKAFDKNDWSVEAINWRNAAGSTALYLYWMRVILNAGILIVLAAGFIVVNNTLEINVLERIREIGTMRAIGATKRFVSIECMLETLFLTLTAGFIGCVLGVIVGFIITKCNITFSNAFLIQLFGAKKFEVSVSLNNIIEAFFFSLVLGLLVWIYPVITALSTSPVKAMAGSK